MCQYFNTLSNICTIPVECISGTLRIIHLIGVRSQQFENFTEKHAWLEKLLTEWMMPFIQFLTILHNNGNFLPAYPVILYKGTNTLYTSNGSTPCA